MFLECFAVQEGIGRINVLLNIGCTMAWGNFSSRFSVTYNNVKVGARILFFSFLVDLR